MSQPMPRLISVRAIEDIIQIQKISERPSVSEVGEIGKEKTDGILYSYNELDPGCEFSEGYFNYLSSEAETANNRFDDSRLKIQSEGDGPEGDSSAHTLSDLVLLDDFKLSEDTFSEMELKYWPSDSDITVLRMKKEYREELSTKVGWEEDKNLTDDASNSLKSLEWESHSLINLAEVVLKEKEQTEGLAPFTIWSKTAEHVQSAVANCESVKVTASPSKVELQTGSEKTSVSQHEEDEKNIELTTVSVHATRSDLDSNISGNNTSGSGTMSQIRNFFRSLLHCGSRKNLAKNIN